jgi:hypothetical protein
LQGLAEVTVSFRCPLAGAGMDGEHHEATLSAPAAAVRAAEGFERLASAQLRERANRCSRRSPWATNRRLA